MSESDFKQYHFALEMEYLNETPEVPYVSTKVDVNRTIYLRAAYRSVVDQNIMMDDFNGSSDVNDNEDYNNYPKAAERWSSCESPRSLWIKWTRTTWKWIFERFLDLAKNYKIITEVE